MASSAWSSMDLLFFKAAQKAKLGRQPPVSMLRIQMSANGWHSS
jgi:hypothetical protein